MTDCPEVEREASHSFLHTSPPDSMPWRSKAAPAYLKVPVRLSELRLVWPSVRATLKVQKNDATLGHPLAVDHKHPITAHLDT